METIQMETNIYAEIVKDLGLLHTASSQDKFYNLSLIHLIDNALYKLVTILFLYLDGS